MRRGPSKSPDSVRSVKLVHSAHSVMFHLECLVLCTTLLISGCMLPGPRPPGSSYRPSSQRPAPSPESNEGSDIPSIIMEGIELSIDELLNNPVIDEYVRRRFLHMIAEERERVILGLNYEISILNERLAYFDRLIEQAEEAGDDSNTATLIGLRGEVEYERDSCRGRIRILDFDPLAPEW